jgi:hypothetical protein
MSSIMRQSFRGGWSLTTQWATGRGLARPVQYTLDGVHCTAEQAQALLHGRDGIMHWTTGSSFVLVNGITVTHEEAALIGAGAGPLAVLLPQPGLRARTLTMQELTT